MEHQRGSYLNELPPQIDTTIENDAMVLNSSNESDSEDPSNPKLAAELARALSSSASVLAQVNFGKKSLISKLELHHWIDRDPLSICNRRELYEYRSFPLFEYHHGTQSRSFKKRQAKQFFNDDEDYSGDLDYLLVDDEEITDLRSTITNIIQH
ncbi:unnamed protein product [Lepeophtheirus salmonis]|uniref:(salmon louse) hypothetical protein n=1 Tax=Lepeophtheirus salmonis TaxID=72036 RepID=A0A7R8CGN9_LEPSM|nr:unnamed protein product [Lepeophtheirus salmonis]CAF2817412.1 unnamed protein product [Lepeophtheirus salmonis]